MNSSETVRVVGVERVDDIPVLMAQLKRMQVAELLDRQFPRHPLWKGELSFGEVACVWLAFILSEGDHRLYHLQPWAQQRLLTLQACLGKTVRPLDFHDDRLADVLDSLADLDRWQVFEADLNQHTVRVYRLEASLFRLDTTTAHSYSEALSEQGLLQIGRARGGDGRPQLKVAAAALDPLGLPVTTLVVPGNRGDDPLYLPLVHQVHRAFGQGGHPFVGDCKMAALATRAYLVSTQDFYLCPLTEDHVSRPQRLALLRPVWEGRQELQRIYRPAAKPGQAEELVAFGFAYDEELRALVGEKEVTWTERRWVVRSVALAEGLHGRLDKRLARATEELGRLAQRKKGKRRLDEEGLRGAAKAVVARHQVEELLTVTVRTQRQERTMRGYRGKPGRLEVEVSYTVEVARQEEAIEQAKGEMGWRAYGTNEVEMPLCAVVWGYRGQYRIEDDWSRLKGRPLSLEPMYLEDQGRMQGLVLLLMLAVRVLTLVEWQVRRQLPEGAEKLEGIYPGQPGRRTSRPSAELLLRAFAGISLTIVEVAGRPSIHITPLTPLQNRLLQLWGLPPDLFLLLALHCPQPPPAISER